MRILQPAEWSKPRGFSHGVELDGPGRWVVLAGQTGGDEKGEDPADLAAQVAVALRRIVQLLAGAGAAPQQIRRPTRDLTHPSGKENPRPGIGAAPKGRCGADISR